MDDTSVGVSFGIEEDRARLVGKGLEHETVRKLAVEMAHFGVCKPSFAVVGFAAFFAHRRTKPWCLFNAICAHEIALFTISPEDFATC